jgi:hypothetical protein
LPIRASTTLKKGEMKSATTPSISNPIIIGVQI